MLPALYCPGVVVALKKVGLSLRYYDIGFDLSPSAAFCEAAAAERPALIWYHPFGLYRSPPQDLAAAGLCAVVIDACHAFRSLIARRARQEGSATVFSFLKEFDWPMGAAVLGDHGRPVSSAPWASALSRRLAGFDPEHEASRGLRTTERAILRLGGKLPEVGEADVLTHLPVFSTDRDATIARLRRAGVLAWRWEEAMPDSDPQAVPLCTALTQGLLLVPLPQVMSRAERTIEIVGEQVLVDWPGRAATGADRTATMPAAGSGTL